MTDEDRVRLHAVFTLPGVRRYIFDDQIIPPEQTAEIVTTSVTRFREHGLGLLTAGPHSTVATAVPPSPSRA